MNKLRDIKLITDYFLVCGLVAVSGFPFLCNAQLNILLLFIFSFFIYIKRSVLFDFKVFFVVIPFFVIEVLQVFFNNYFDPTTMVGTYIRIFLGFFIISIVGRKFVEYYVNSIYFFSIISFIFFIPSIISPAFFNFCIDKICVYFPPLFMQEGGFYEIFPTNILFCFHEVILQEYRNPGPFWEPGAFSVFLNLALIFNLIVEKKIQTKKNIVLILALISTLSTAGYIAFFVLVFSFYTINESFFKKIIFILIMLPLILTLYFSLDFLNDKVEQNIALANTTTSSRFGSAAADLTDFSTNPIIGWGRGAMRFGGRLVAFFSSENHRNNSVTDLLASYGIFIFILYFYNYYLSLKSLCLWHSFNANFAFFALVVILALGFSQSIFLKPFFYGLLFLHYNTETKLNNTYSFLI